MLTKKEFALKAIKPYAKDPNICARAEGGSCLNLTTDGRMCVAGKYLLEEVRNSHESGVITTILREYGNDQSKVFIPEAVDILTPNEWYNLQRIHDAISLLMDNNFISDGLTESQIKGRVGLLGLFTYEEMMAD